MLLSILSIPYDSGIDRYRYRKFRYFCRAWWWIHVHDFDSGDRIISRTTWRHHAERLYGMFCCSVFYLQLRALFFVEQYQILLIRHTKLDLGPKYIELHSIPSHHPSDPHFIAQRANLLHCQVLPSFVKSEIVFINYQNIRLYKYILRLLPIIPPFILAYLHMVLCPPFLDSLQLWSTLVFFRFFGRSPSNGPSPKTPSMI